MAFVSQSFINWAIFNNLGIIVSNGANFESESKLKYLEIKLQPHKNQPKASIRPGLGHILFGNHSLNFYITVEIKKPSPFPYFKSYILT